MGGREFKFDPKKAALLVIDVQEYFTRPGSHAYIPSSKKIISRINGLIEAFHEIGRPVIFTRHIDVDPKNVMSRWWKDSIRSSDPLSRLNGDILIRKRKIIVKHAYDAFFKTPLERMLKRSGATQVLITGVVTHLCCETTARSAFCRDFEVFFAVDGTAAYDKRHHKAAVYNLSHGFAVPVRCSKIRRACSPCKK